jgi:hypothetical protein
MTITWADLRAICIPHTVDVRGGIVSGYLVRCTSSRTNMGHVWQTGSVWRFRTCANLDAPLGAAFQTGERPTQRSAVAALRALISGVGDPRPAPPVPTDHDAPRARVITAPPVHQRHAPARPTPRPAVVRDDERAAPEALPAQRIVWTDTPMGDLTAAMAARLGRKA